MGAVLMSAVVVIAVGVPTSRALPRADSDDPSTSSSSTSVPGEVAPIESTTTTTTTPPIRLPRVLLVGDSTMAALRWFEDAKKSLEGAKYILDVESCRSVAGRSCYGREQRIPLNAFTVIQRAERSTDVVVLMAGTHSYYRTINDEFRRVKRLAAKRGMKLVVLTLRDPKQHKKKSVSKNGMRGIPAINSMVKANFGHPKSNETYVADWDGFSEGRGDWFRRDGIHLNLRGVLALGWYISNVVAHVTGEPCPGRGEGTCTMPTRKDSLRDWVRNYDVPYTEQHCYEDGTKRKKVCERDRRMP